MQNWKDRYNAAHLKHTTERTPSVVKDGFYTPPQIPKVLTANGLTRFVENYINWMGWRATRINTTGRVVGGRYIYGTTRRGTADISSTLPGGRSCMWEIKVGKDRPSEHQLKEQAKERAAGGEYFFVSTPEQFFEYLDEFLSRK
jgi:hypothetical protein